MTARKSICLIASAILVLVAVAISSAQPRWGHAGKLGWQHEPKMAKLNLTEEQQQKMADLRLAFQKELLPLRTELQSKTAELQLLKTEATPNLSKIDQVIDQIEKIRTKIQKARVRHQMAIRGILTPEQQKLWDSRLLQGPGHRMMGRKSGCALECF